MTSFQDQLAAIEREGLKRIAAAGDARELDAARVSVLGKKGALTQLLRGLSALDADERPKAGGLVNKAKQALQAAITERETAIEAAARLEGLSGPPVDVSLPAYGQPTGSIHPLSSVTQEIADILSSLGFVVAEGPDIEDDYHNFEALNIPADHPARDMQDTFFTKDGRVLRTHTSPVQIRVMLQAKPPVTIIAPGAVYRHDDDITHSPMFHQIEGLHVDKGVTFRHLKYVLTEFLARFFGPEYPVRFRPSYFPFTEPSAEVDVGCVICGADGGPKQAACRVCKATGWIEILGAGMVDPAVFEHVGYDSEVYTGFAFGFGVERMAMLKYRIDDIRLFYTGDLRFLSQF